MRFETPLVFFRGGNTCIYRYQIEKTVKLGDKERFDKEQISVKEPFPVTK